MKFGDLVGTISVDPTHLQKFIDVWFVEGDEVLLRGIPLSGSRYVMNLAEDVSIISGQTKETIENELCRNSSTQDIISLYIQMNPVKNKEDISLYVGSKVHDIRNIYGCFVDLDVKDGGFDSKEEIKSFLDSLEHTPTIVVDNGVSGGMHAYWRFTENDIDPNRSAILNKWWAYMNEKATEFKGTRVKIDKLTDVTRISRMPSSIYWPREGQKYGTVTIDSCSEIRYPYDVLDSVANDSYTRYTERLQAIREKANENRIGDINEWWETLKELEGDSKSEEDIRFHVKNHHDRFGIIRPAEELKELSETNLKLVSKIIENYVNEYVDWSEILEPHGWTLLKEKSNSRVWARPGRDERSAETDYSSDGINSSSAMSLLSSSEETGLSDLKDAGVILTKSRVLLRLDFNDDFKMYLSYLLAKKREFDENNR